MRYLFAFIAIMLVFAKEKTDWEWREYLGGPDRNHYTPLTQINRANVKDLKVAWEFKTGDSSGQIQCNPIVVDGVLYGTTASIEVFALNAATGKEIWRNRNASAVKWYSLNRGVSYWRDGNDKRIFFSAGNLLYALDASTGKPVQSFGDSGRVDLRSGLGKQAANKFVISSTPGTIFENLIIMPLRLSEGADAAPGYIQAFDTRTGKLVWVFKTIPGPGEFGYETWEPNNYLNIDVGGANSWAGMSVDHERGMIFVPTGSAGFDFWGGNRKGNNLFANCLLALDVRTGKRIWHFQFTHHDVWDRDIPSPPNLLKINLNGKMIDAVVQITKQGFVYAFERETGRPIYEIKEMPVAQDGVEGERLSLTQPIPVLPEAFSRQTLTEKDLNPWSENKEELLEAFRKYRKNRYDPPSEQGTLIFPGFDGGGEWGGASFDQESGLMYVNANEMPFILKLNKNKNYLNNLLSIGNRIYINYCISCHKTDFSGSPASGIPSLKEISSRRDSGFIKSVVSRGKGMMPGFVQLKPSEVDAVSRYVMGMKDSTRSVSPADERVLLPYVFDGYNKFLDKNGYPAIAPPWGTLNAINLNTGKIVWKKVLGEYRELTEKGIPLTGTENYGGSVVTKGGLIFIAATRDERIRAFDKTTGDLLWEGILPASGFATPSVYEVEGRQFLVIACGGTKLGTKKGESYVAFALPESEKNKN